MDHKTVAKDIIQNIGGEENVNNVVHCATRLRFRLNDETLAETEILKENPNIIQVVKSGGQYQVVIGNEVSKVYDSMLETYSLEGEDKSRGGTDKEDSNEKNSVISTLIDVISGVFTPILGVLSGAGIIKGFLSLAITFDLLSETTGTYQILNALSDGAFLFLPIMLAFTSARRFKVNPMIAVSIAFALVYPEITNIAESGEAIGFFGIPVVLSPGGYVSSVIPIIVAVWLLSLLDKWLQEVIPSMISMFMIPILELLIIVPLTFIVIGPIGTLIGNGIGSVIGSLYNLSPIITGLVLGGSYQILVMFGMHWGLFPLLFLELAEQGYTVLSPLFLSAIFAQAGAALGIAIRSKNKKTKGLAFSGTITSLFGITEPTVYGLTLPLRKPFIVASLAAAIGGAIIGAAEVKAFAVGLLNIFSFSMFVSPVPEINSNVLMAIVATVVAFLGAFIGTLIVGFEEENDVVTETENDSKNLNVEEFYSPLKGEVIPLELVPDEVFSSGMMGPGIGIEPSDGILYSPIAGTVKMIFDTNHAIGIETRAGTEVLLHIGIDTVEMEGAGFEPHVQTGDQISVGERLIDFDIEQIKDAGYSPITILIITNKQDEDTVIFNAENSIEPKESLITVNYNNVEGVENNAI